MRFLTRAQLSGFRCYATADVELDHLTILVGPNNSGKSALLRAIRRLASVDLNRHAREAERGGVGFWGRSSMLKLAPGDMQDAAEHTRLTLDISDDLPLPTGAEYVPRVYVRFHPRLGPAIWAGGRPEPKDQEAVDQPAEAMVRALCELPIILIPETRALPEVLPLRYEQDDSRFHEEVVDAARILPTVVEWVCTEPARLAVLADAASELIGEKLTILPTPHASSFKVGVGTAPARDVRDVGVGVVEALTLALALTLYDRGLLLYEEPELHLHPRVQRRIVDKLSKLSQDAPWQFCLTTHSNHVLDHAIASGTSVFAVSRSEHASQIEQVIAKEDRERAHQLFDVLGVRPSSGLQPQALIWVEGPSDAAYLRFFFGIAAPELTEYVDYSFAYFGGSLLAHDTASSTLIDGLIDLVGIHRNSFVVLDSDRSRVGDELGKEYAREFVRRSDARRLWISWGREIENYLSEEVLCWAAANCSPTECAAHLETIDRRFSIFAHQVAELRTARGRQRAHQDASESNKVGFAGAAVAWMREQTGTDWLAVGDLRERVEVLVSFIHKARH